MYLILKYGFTFIIVVCFVYDFIFNNNKLIIFAAILPWYSLYQLLYNVNSFLYYDMEYIFDTIITTVLYSGNDNNIYRLYHEYETIDCFFSVKKPQNYTIEDDEYHIYKISY